MQMGIHFEFKKYNMDSRLRGNDRNVNPIIVEFDFISLYQAE